MSRESNTLSATIRNAWDGRDLQTLAKNAPARATQPHISIIGHTTRIELKRYLNDTERGNGFGNRFLWVCVRRAQILPRGGRIKTEAVQAVNRKLKTAVDFAQRNAGATLDFDGPAATMWDVLYRDLTQERTGLTGAIMARAEAHVVRLALIYALLDQKPKYIPNIWPQDFNFGNTLNDQLNTSLGNHWGHLKLIIFWQN